MKENHCRKLGGILGYIAVSIGVITFGLWFIGDAENSNTALGAVSNIVIGVLVVMMSKRHREAQDS